MFNLTILSWNARGLKSNFDQLVNFLAHAVIVPSILAIQETHLSQLNLEDNLLLQIQGFTLVANSRVDQKGGGTALYIRNSIPYKLENLTLGDLEYTEIHAMLDDCRTPLRIISIYLPPNKKINEVNLLILGSHRNTIMVGDFNAKSPLWGSKVRDARGKIIERCLLEDTDLVCVNKGDPTHLASNGLLTHLDLTFCSSNLAAVAEWSVLDDNLGSDHYPTVTLFGKNVVTYPYSRTTWNLSKADWNGFTDYLNHSHPELTTLSMDRSRFSEFSKFILSAAKVNIPIKTHNSDDTSLIKLPYWTDLCTVVIAKRRLAEKIMTKNRTFENIFKYQDAKAVVKQTLNDAKCSFWQRYVSSLSSDSKVGSVWKAIKTLSGKYSPNDIPIKVNNTAILSNLDKANIFAKEFAHISSNKNLPSNFMETRKATATSFLTNIDACIHSIPDMSSNALNLPFTPGELDFALENVNINSATGADTISMQMLYHLPPVWKNELLNIYNNCWNEGYLPATWNVALITPILKSNSDKCSPSSYRPISLTSAYSKVMEKMVAQRISWYLESSNILNPIQAGFRKFHSTIDHALRLKTEIENALSVGGITLAVFLDFSRAFDLVWSDGLLLKLLKYKIGGNCLNYIKNFLENRSAEVVVNGSHSTSFCPENGTPQGCVLSPILFLIFINDFPTLSKFTSSAIFADDSSVWRSGTNIRIITHHLQLDIAIIESWCTEWGFVLNIKKCTAVVFTRKKNVTTQLFLNNLPITFANKFSFLGFMFDSHLTWSQHIDNIVQRSKARINLLKCLSHNDWGSNRNVLLSVYRAMIRSIIDYGCVLYHSASPSLLKRLDSVQCSSLTLVTGAMRGTALSSLLLECDEMPLSVRRTWIINKYLAKVKSRPTHVTNALIQGCKMMQLGTNFPCRWTANLLAINNIISSDTITGSVTASVPPWTLSPLLTDTGLNILSSGNLKTASFSKRQTTVRSYLENLYKNADLVYADGARSFDGHVGAAVYIPSKDVKLSYRLSDNLSIDTAELDAIFQALSLITKYNLQKPVIISDCRNVINSLAKPTIFSDRLIHVCLELASMMAIPPVVVWVPGHVGLCDHDVVDQMAKHALALPNVSRVIFPNLIEATDLLKTHYHTLGISEAKSIATGRSYKDLFPNGTNKSERLLPRKKDVTISRLRLHHCRLSKYLHKIGLHSTGLCDVCGVDGTVEHFLFSCELHSELSLGLIQLARSKNHTLSPKLALSEEPYLDYIYRYVCANKVTI